MARGSQRRLIVDSTEGFRELDELLKHSSAHGLPVGLDTETTGCDPDEQSPVENAVLWCLTLAIGKPSTQTPSPFTEVFVPRPWLGALKPWLESDAPKVGTNIFGYEKHVFANDSIHLKGVVGDTLRMSRLLDPSKTPEQGGHGLKPWGAYMGYHVLPFKHVARRRKVGKLMAYKRDRVVQKGSVTVHYTAAAPYHNLLKGYTTVSLEEIWNDCPHRREEIIQYATQDACMSLDAYWILKHRLESRKW